MSENEQSETPPKPRTRLIVPETENKPKTRLIAPAVDENAEETVAEEPAVEVAPLTAPDPEEAVEPGTEEAERGEFTVINEDTGETHSVPVKVSAMSPPPAEEAVYVEPETDPEPAAPAPVAPPQTLQPQLSVQPPPAAAEQYVQPPPDDYVARQQLAAHQQPEQQQQYYDPAAVQQDPGYAPQALPVQQPQPEQPQLPYTGLQIPAQRGIPSWALLFIGLLAGFLIALLLFKFTEFGPMIRPPEAM